MATSTTALSRHLQLQLQVGTASNGKPKLKNLNVAHISAQATDDDVLALGQALAPLCSEPLFQIARVDVTALAPVTNPPSA